MKDLETIMRIINIITALSFGVNVHTLVIWPMSQRHKANKLIKFKLQAISKYDGYLIDKECLLDNASLNDRNEALKRDIAQIINPWLEDIENYIGEDNSKLMYTNLKTLRVETLKRSFSRDGDYQPIINLIRIRKISSLLHELLHMASSYYDKEKDITEIGFLQVEYKTSAEIGRGLNEGYTELLASRIDEDKPSSTAWLVVIAKLFELFFDNPKDMENLYFRHNLPGFIHHMEKFIPYDELMDILLRLDRINDFYSKQVPIFIYLEVINIEKELYGYFVKSNPGEDKLNAFESIIREKKLLAAAFNRDKMKEIRDSAKSETIEYEEVDVGRKMSA